MTPNCGEQECNMDEYNIRRTNGAKGNPCSACAAKVYQDALLAGANGGLRSTVGDQLWSKGE